MADAYDRASWDRRWEQALREHGDALGQRPPNPYLPAVAEGLASGAALDAGCGHGAESIWLAAHGWRVTAVDFATAALDFARSNAEAIGADVAERIEWVQGDLGVWTPPIASYELVLCLYVHIAGSRDEFVKRMAGAVAPGGSLLMVGHQGIDQNQASVSDVVDTLDPSEWAFSVAEERPRAPGGTDAVVHVRRLA